MKISMTRQTLLYLEVYRWKMLHIWKRVFNQTSQRQKRLTLTFNNIDEEYTPKLFSEDVRNSAENDLEENDNTQTDKLFDQDLNEDEDFEIPAFLRKQKF